MKVDKDWIQDRIDELYVLEKQAQERLGRLEVHYERHVNSIKSQEKSVHELVHVQRDGLITINEKLEAVHAWYQQVVKLGSVIAGLFLVGLAYLFLWWWHVHTIVKDTQALQLAMEAELKHLPALVKKKGKTYIRVVPHADVPDLKDLQGRPLKGDYAQVYFLDEQN